MLGIKCEAEFGILIKALQKGNAQGVAQVPIAIEFVGTLGIEIGVREKLLTLCTRFIDEFVGIDFIVEIPDKTRDRDVGFAHDGVGNGIAFIFVIAHLVAVVHHQLMACEPGLCSSEACENVFRVHLRFASLHFSRVGDVAVIHNSAVFLIGKVVVHHHRLQFVAVAQIGSRTLPHEIFVCLIFVTSLAIDIIQTSPDG